MRRLTVLLAALGAALALGLGSASAVQYGQPDGNGHPYVGLVVFYNADGVPVRRCSGALLSSTVFLTAGHCAGANAATGVTPVSAQVWFDPGPIPLDPTYVSGSPCSGAITQYPCGGGSEGTPAPDPDWPGVLNVPDSHDLGVVVLSNPHPLSGYAQLPTEGYLDKLATQRGTQETEFTLVGYGDQLVKPVLLAERTRYVATASLVNLRNALTDGFNIQHTDSPGQGHGSGGDCFGDSGGPLLQGDVVVGVNSFIFNANCKGTGFAYRVDIADSLNFINGFLS
jgi:hypothetical protein